MDRKFTIRTFSLRLFLSDSFYLISNILAVIKFRMDRRIDRAIVKKIMIVTSAVNGFIFVPGSTRRILWIWG